MKKNRLFVLGIITMFVAILSLTLVSGTMARYSSNVSATDTAKAAKWSLSINDKIVVGKQVETFKINLFNDTEVYEVGSTTDDSDVANGSGVTIIAPGTQGQFSLKITNGSEVSAKYTVELEEVTTSGIPLKYSSDGQSWSDSLADIIGELKIGGILEETITLYWKWDFGQNVNDNQHGFDETVVEVKVTVTFEQID